MKNIFAFYDEFFITFIYTCHTIVCVSKALVATHVPLSSLIFVTVLVPEFPQVTKSS